MWHGRTGRRSGTWGLGRSRIGIPLRNDERPCLCQVGAASERACRPLNFGGGPHDRQAAITLCWLTSGAREDDELLGRSGHRDIAVDRSFDALAERLWVDEDDQVELEPLRQLRGQRPDAGRRPERASFNATSADDAGDPVGMRVEPAVEDRVQIRDRTMDDGDCRCCGWRSARWRSGARPG